MLIYRNEQLTTAVKWTKAESEESDLSHEDREEDVYDDSKLWTVNSSVFLHLLIKDDVINVRVFVECQNRKCQSDIPKFHIWRMSGPTGLEDDAPFTIFLFFADAVISKF